MTTARHTPEEELHAYLDQALSRSQAADIERHLAHCARCQRARNEIAGLRDRTTALLAQLRPPLVIPPPFESLQVRAATRTDVRRRWLVRGAWAASLAAAVLAGWSVRSQVRAPELAVADTAAPAIEASPGTDVAVAPALPANRAPAVAEVTTHTPAEPRATPAARPEPAPAVEGRFVRSGSTAVSTPVQLASRPTAASLRQDGEGLGTFLASDSQGDDIPDLITQPMGTDAGMSLKGLWRTVSPDSAGTLRSVDMPLVPGLPVVQVRVQPGENGPVVTAVDQMLQSGEVVRTLAGPAPRVAALVDSRDQQPQAAPGADGSGRMTVTIQQGDRMVAVTGPSAALGSLLSRVSPRRRY